MTKHEEIIEISTEFCTGLDQTTLHPNASITFDFQHEGLVNQFLTRTEESIRFIVNAWEYRNGAPGDLRIVLNKLSDKKGGLANVGTFYSNDERRNRELETYFRNKALKH